MNTMNKIKFVLKIFLGLSLIFMVTGSGCNEPTEQESFEINILSISEPQLNELYRIEFEYTPEARMEDQFIEVQSLNFEGAISRKYFGCPPQSYLAPNTPTPDDCGNEIEALDCPNDQRRFNNKCRAFEDVFTGPIIVSITAKDTQSNSYKRKSVILKRPNTHFKATIQPSNNGYPIMGDLAGKPIEFFKYFGILNARRDGLIDDLNEPPYSSTFMNDEPFFARSTKVEESESFGFERGRLFPILRNGVPEPDNPDAAKGFLATPQGLPYDGEKDFADLVVFAGTIALNGNYETKEEKTDEDEVINFTVVEQFPTTITSEGTTSSFFQQKVLMTQIDLVYPLTNIMPAITPMIPSNIRFGNIQQGLIIPTFGGENSPLLNPSISSETDITHTRTNQDVTFINGNIPSAGVSFIITTAQNPLFPISAELTNIDWQGVPVYPDDKLELLVGSEN